MLLRCSALPRRARELVTTAPPALPLPRLAAAFGGNEAVSHSRAMSASIPYPVEPYRKQLLARKRQEPVRRWPSLSSPALTEKYLRFAERTSEELGVTAELRSFDEAAAAFSKPPLIKAVAVLERPNVTMRDVEDWEADFASLAWTRKQAKAKRYPQQLIDMITASSTVVEGGGEAGSATGGGSDYSSIGQVVGGGESSTGKGKKKDAAAAAAASSGAASGATESSKTQAPVASGSSSASDAAAPDAASSTSGTGNDSGSSSSAPTGLSSFYDRGSSSRSTSTDESSGAMTAAPRESMADKIGDVRSLDRAYTQRLVLLVRSRGDGVWGFPCGVALGGEALRSAAERHLRAAVAVDPELDLWFVGHSPIGHSLEVFTPAEQTASGAYGAKVFYYRVELLGGRPKLEEDSRYDDFVWVTRDEAEKYLSRPLYKYAHQIIGSGPGEEFTRHETWHSKVQAKGITVAQAAGRKNFRVTSARLAGLRLPVIATQAQAAAASLKWDDSSKAGVYKSEFAAFHARRKVASAQSAAYQAALAIPTAAAAAQAARSRTTAQAGAGMA